MVRNEATRFCAWMKHRMSSAAREDAQFTLLLTDRADRGYEATLIWLSGAKKTRHESYLFEDTTMSYEGVNELIFSGRWFTMTPAATFIVKSKKKPEIRLFVTIAGTGYMEIKERL
ncbi:MAG: hypothetical protein Q4D58_00225 [Synergistaceae bacterium]|nr:hypothetical protein [Synergistaceae bacterium]